MSDCQCSGSSCSKKYSSPEEEIKALKKDKKWANGLSLLFYGLSGVWAVKSISLAYQTYEAIQNSSNERNLLMIGACALGTLGFAGMGYIRRENAKEITKKIGELEKRLTKE